MLAKKIKNVNFVYYMRSANKLVNRIIKESLRACIIINEFSLLLFLKLSSTQTSSQDIHSVMGDPK